MMTAAQMVAEANRATVALTLAVDGRIEVRGPRAARMRIIAIVALCRGAVVALLDRRCACGALLNPGNGSDRERCVRCERAARGELASWCIGCGKITAGTAEHFCDACAVDDEFLAALDTIEGRASSVSLWNSP